MDKETLALAQGLQHSNVPEVAQLAKGLLGLNDAYEDLKHRYVKATAEKVMATHGKLLSRLAKMEEEE